MLSLRRVIAWILLAAVPLQGYAGAAMLCHLRGAAVPQAVEHAHDVHASSHADHAGHHLPAPDGEAQQGLGDSHGCAACAAGCHAIGPTVSGGAASLDLQAPAPAARPAARIPARDPPLPDKPPRAWNGTR